MIKEKVNGKFFLEKTLALLFTKYIKAKITYEGITRVEKFEYPKDAIREALLNAGTVWPHGEKRNPGCRHLVPDNWAIIGQFADYSIIVHPPGGQLPYTFNF